MSQDRMETIEKLAEVVLEGEGPVSSPEKIQKELEERWAQEMKARFPNAEVRWDRPLAIVAGDPVVAYHQDGKNYSAQGMLVDDRFEELREAVTNVLIDNEVAHWAVEAGELLCNLIVLDRRKCYAVLLRPVASTSDLEDEFKKVWEKNGGTFLLVRELSDLTENLGIEPKIDEG